MAGTADRVGDNGAVPLLTVVIPAYNAQDYLGRCVDSVLVEGVDDVEVVIVDDGSQDGTPALADRFQALHPERVRAIHQPNGGHGAGINTGLALARGTYFKVVDSDDWLDAEALRTVLGHLRTLEERGRRLDLLVTNFVYEKQGKRHKRVVDYRHALPRNQVFGWDQVGCFRIWQYLLMHSMVYRTALLRECGLVVPEHSFYVDNYFAFVPLTRVRRLGYLDVDLYRYFIGRCDQSVNEQVMIGRIDQQIDINMRMVEHLAQVRRSAEEVPASLLRYMTRYAALVSTVSSVLLVRDGSPEALEKWRALWDRIEAIDPDVSTALRRVPVARVASTPRAAARGALHVGYDLSRVFIGFN